MNNSLKSNAKFLLVVLGIFCALFVGSCHRPTPRPKQKAQFKVDGVCFDFNMTLSKLKEKNDNVVIVKHVVPSDDYYKDCVVYVKGHDYYVVNNTIVVTVNENNTTDNENNNYDDATIYEENNINYFCTNSSSYKTPKGIHVGSTWGEMEKAHPNLQFNLTYYYYNYFAQKYETAIEVWDPETCTYFAFFSSQFSSVQWAGLMSVTVATDFDSYVDLSAVSISVMESIRSSVTIAQIAVFDCKGGEDNQDKTMVTNPKEIAIEGELKMYLLDAIDEPYSQVVNQYRETNGTNNYLAFVVETDRSINVLPYLEDGEDDFIDGSVQSAFMVVPEFQYTGRSFAEKYANKRVRATGILYAPGAGWRNATSVVMSLKDIRVIGESSNDDNRNSGSQSDSNIARKLENTKWKSDFYASIAYNKSMFDNESTGSFTLSNGDCIHYKFDVDMDFVPEYSIIFYMDNKDIRNKYKIGVLEKTDAEGGYIGKDDDDRRQVKVTISMMGFQEMCNKNVIVIIKKK